MSRLKPVMVAILLTLFALASSHPLLEGFGLIHQEEDHAHNHGHEHPDSSSDHALADGEVPISANRNQIKAPSSDDLGVVPIFIALASEIFLLQDLERLTVFDPTSPPPDIQFTWQVYSRAALPVRAPSFVS